MGRPLKERSKDKPEAFAVRVAGDLAIQLREYMDANGYVSPSEALREILTVYFASNPIDGVVAAARHNASMNAKHWLLTRLAVTLAELQQEMKSQIITIENSGFGK